jgi:hypothetical protein
MNLLSKKYTLTDIKNISFMGFECILSNETLLLIEELTNKVGSSSYVKTPIFNKRTNKNIHFSKKNEGNFIENNQKNSEYKKIKVNEILNDDDWDLLSSFEITKINKKEGIDNEIINVRSLLNMITTSNLNTNLDSIIMILDKLNIYSLEDNYKIYNLIIDITSGNSFYSDIYAKLYSKLSVKYDLMNKILFEKIDFYMNYFEKNLESRENNNYDDICKTNKENDKCEAFSLFLVNLEKYNVIQKEVIIQHIHLLLQKLFIYLKNNDTKTIVDKIIDNLFILYKKEWIYNTSIKINDNKINVIEFINGIIKNINMNIYPGISNKSKSYFKLIDILEK